MSKSAIRTVVQAVCLMAVLAVLAIPLSNLMVGQTSVSSSAVSSSTAADLDQSSGGSSAVSALMAGSAVGPSRGARLSPRHPASAFVP
jgi:hypothetical protein